jgi:hypothetical protein
MERRYETIISQDGIEIIVTYHIGHDFDGNEVVDINHVDIVLGGGSIDLLPLFNDKQYQVIMDALPIH